MLNGAVIRVDGGLRMCICLFEKTLVHCGVSNVERRGDSRRRGAADVYLFV